MEIMSIEWKDVNKELPKEQNVQVLVKFDTYPYEKNPNVKEIAYRSTHFRNNIFFMGYKAEFKKENDFEYFESETSYIPTEYELVRHKITHWAYINEPEGKRCLK